VQLTAENRNRKATDFAIFCIACNASIRNRREHNQSLRSLVLLLIYQAYTMLPVEKATKLLDRSNIDFIRN